MFDQVKFKAAVVAAVLVALLTAVGGLVISQAAGGSSIQARVYDDAVRFTVQNENVEILRAEVFDLGGKRLFDSGPAMGNALDWAMTTESGERVAHGVYLYVITAWDSQGKQVKSQVGKLALVPGGVGLGTAPPLASESEGGKSEVRSESEVRALITYNENLIVNGTGSFRTAAQQVKLVETDEGDKTWSFEATRGDFNITEVGVSEPFRIEAGAPTNAIRVSSSGNIGIGTSVPATELHVEGRGYFRAAFQQIKLVESDESNKTWSFEATRGDFNITEEGVSEPFRIEAGAPTNAIRVKSSGKVGIGTSSPDATLAVHGSATNLLALYDPAVSTTDPKFRVTKTGDVRADGSYYCGAGAPGCYQSGDADVAERINTSEWVEQGNVVEVDPEHPGFFRKTRSPYSTSVAGIISTSPGVVLGNDFDAKSDRWEDNRPMLALAGRVPVKVTTENGTIQIGDLLVSSSTPGYAMRCSDRAACVGATIGKALEPLEQRAGTIQVQVMLR